MFKIATSEEKISLSFKKAIAKITFIENGTIIIGRSSFMAKHAQKTCLFSEQVTGMRITA